MQRVLLLSSHQYQSPNWEIWGYLSILSLLLLLGYWTGVTSICYVIVNCNCFSKVGKLLIIIYCAIAGFLSHSYSSDSKSQQVMNDCSSMTLFTMFAINIQEYILVWFIALTVSPPGGEKQNPWCSCTADWLYCNIGDMYIYYSQPILGKTVIKLKQSDD